MTGIERLRELAGGINPRTVWSVTRDEYDNAHGLDVEHKGGQLCDLLADIADQIERERACDSDTAENIRLIVGGVIDDMERHVSGVEGADDSPVARWARELRRALKSYTSDERDAQNPSCADAAETADVTSGAAKVTLDPAEDVSMSAYDLLPEEEREAIAWVSEHGGLDYVKSEWRSRVSHDRYERRRQRLLGHIAECEAALRRRNERISKLECRVKALTNERDELRKRAMPEGMEWLVEAWPRFEDSEPVRIGDDYECWCGDTEVVRSVTIRKGRSVLNESQPHSFVVSDGPFTAHGERVKRPAVLAADGEPLEVGQTVWDENGDELVIGALEDGGHTVTCRYVDVGDAIPVHGIWSPSDLTHERPDSWERLEKDACKGVCDYFNAYKCDECEHVEGGCCKNMARDLVRRCRALAERSE